jgi:hypothetical protein
MNPNFNPTGEDYGKLLDALFDFGYIVIAVAGDRLLPHSTVEWDDRERDAFYDGMNAGQESLDDDEDIDDDSYDEYDDGQPSEMQEWHDFDPDC